MFFRAVCVEGGEHMSDADHRSRVREMVTDTDDLLSRFRNVREALPEKAIAKPSSECFHRRDAEREKQSPACVATDSTNYHGVNVDEALLSGLRPCRGCWKAVLEYLAGNPDSPVQYRSPDATPEPTLPTTDEPIALEDSDTQRPSLTSVTDKVMIDGGAKYHAPAEGETLCGRSGYRVVERRVVKTHYSPCQDCFTSDTE